MKKQLAELMTALQNAHETAREFEKFCDENSDPENALIAAYIADKVLFAIAKINHIKRY